REPADAKQTRLRFLEQPHGIWDCTRCNLCIEVCPKNVQPMEAIIRLRRAAIGTGLTQSGGARHLIGFLALIRREGRLNEALMPLLVVGFHVRRLLHIAPLGMRMLLHGKVPSPLAPPIPGIAQVRAIFSSLGRLKRIG
ncbi:MAG: succinate dehydrogenase, partial [Nitrospirota bacterium]|nr:succinate dehydrogenase [Nitrospirota bacterium]